MVISYICPTKTDFHNTGKVTVRNSLMADNMYHVRYGAFNSIVTLHNSTIDAMSDDYKYRLNGGSDNYPHTSRRIYASINSDVNADDPVPDSLALHGVIFQNNVENSKTFEFYEDDRNYNQRGFGNPIDGTSYPYFKCGMSYYHSFLEDDSGTLLAPQEPSHGHPGFIVAGREGMIAFLPEGVCETISYSGSNAYQPDGCSYYCKGVCLRSVEIEPKGVHSYTKMPEWVNVAAHGKPKCANYISANDFTFNQTGTATNYCHKAASSGDVCCSNQCGGKCGGSGCCNHGPGGCDGCCASTTIRNSGRICDHFYDTSCLIPPEEST